MVYHVAQQVESVSNAAQSFLVARNPAGALGFFNFHPPAGHAGNSSSSAQGLDAELAPVLACKP